MTTLVKTQLVVENNSHKAKIIIKYGMFLGIKPMLILTLRYAYWKFMSGYTSVHVYEDGFLIVMHNFPLNLEAVSAYCNPVDNTVRII